MVPRLFALVVILAGCASTSVPKEAQAVRDYVALAEFEQVSYVRMYRQLRYFYVNDYFVSIGVGNRYYLLEFVARCRALRSETFTPSMVDFRKDANYLREMDTIRGCPVEKIYQATPEQLVEVRKISRANTDGTIVATESN